MSHAMEFPYPQSMANCATCHEGKLDTVLSDENFNITTCKSCHPMTGAKSPAEGENEPAYDTTGLALATIIPPDIHGSLDLNTADCLSCHGEGKGASTFKQIHTGYDQAIYTAEGVKYNEAIKVTIDEATFDGAKLAVKFSAAMDPAIEGLDVAAIQPTVLVSLYGWDTKDFIVGAHERPVDDNGDGAIDSKDARALEFKVGDEHPRLATVSAAGGKWEITADLTAWTDLIGDGTVKRVEVGILPALKNADGLNLAVSAVTRTFDLGANAFDDEYFSPIARVTDGCDTCHGALATNFHSPSYGGSITACRMCHITKAGASHLEMQSRSLDSYIHAIHSGQAFDIADINFADPVEAMHYNHHVEFPYPTHGSTNCESCHLPGAYDVPDQSMSLPGLLSASADELNGLDRKVTGVPATVTGPAVRACGGCHRAELINEDAFGELTALNQHFMQGGYMVEAGEDSAATLESEFARVMEFFK
jgi:OmcA/MtrC family decaheme c-type cytochrome